VARANAPKRKAPPGYGAARWAGLPTMDDIKSAGISAGDQASGAKVFRAATGYNRFSTKNFFKLLSYFVDAVGFGHHTAEAMLGIVDNAGIIGIPA
jgi:hypothetical protein